MDVSDEFVPYLNITTRLEDTPDQELLGELGGGGFPSMVFLEPETGALLTEHYWRPGSAEEARAQLAEAQAKAKLLTDAIAKAKASPDDAGAQASAKLMRAMTNLEDLSVEELEELGKTEGLLPAVKQEFDGWIAGKKVSAVQERAGEEADSRDEYFELLQEGFYGLLKEGVRLPPDHDSAQMYYDVGLTAAVAKEDRKLAMVAYDGYRKTLEHMAEQYPDLKEKVDAAIASAKERLDGIPAKEE